jgi:protein-S-isoprenylcysteine O-methyltransferase Ste14
MLFKTLIFTILVPGAVTVLIPLMLLPHYIRPPMRLGVFRFTGAILILLGTGTYLRCAWDFATYGRGTPAPIAPPEDLVIRGLYRFVRNPMYVGVLLVLAGEAILFESSIHFGYAAVVFLLFHLFVVIYEEPILQRKFGGSYANYRATVPRAETEGRGELHFLMACVELCVDRIGRAKHADESSYRFGFAGSGTTIGTSSYETRDGG